ncbi:hypothetical protein EI94DRAFT_1708299 [Lactarius quietus]|nr:hypothetical protein EI94DRAFT_1708299 [Lactarius quietus]
MARAFLSSQCAPLCSTRMALQRVMSEEDAVLAVLSATSTLEEPPWTTSMHAETPWQSDTHQTPPHFVNYEIANYEGGWIPIVILKSLSTSNSGTLRRCSKKGANHGQILEILDGCCFGRVTNGSVSDQRLVGLPCLNDPTHCGRETYYSRKQIRTIIKSMSLPGETQTGHTNVAPEFVANEVCLDDLAQHLAIFMSQWKCVKENGRSLRALVNMSSDVRSLGPMCWAVYGLNGEIQKDSLAEGLTLTMSMIYQLEIPGSLRLAEKQHRVSHSLPGRELYRPVLVTLRFFKFLLQLVTRTGCQHAYNFGEGTNRRSNHITPWLGESSRLTYQLIRCWHVKLFPFTTIVTMTTIGESLTRVAAGAHYRKTTQSINVEHDPLVTFIHPLVQSLSCSALGTVTWEPVM